MLAAPCCQYDLQAQLDRAVAPADWDPVLRHGIVRERLGDLLTDSLRAEVLRAHGYRTDVIEFTSTEHTGKNLMISAVKQSPRKNPDRLREQFRAITEQYGIRQQRLANLLGEL